MAGVPGAADGVGGGDGGGGHLRAAAAAAAPAPPAAPLRALPTRSAIRFRDFPQPPQSGKDYASPLLPGREPMWDELPQEIY